MSEHPAEIDAETFAGKLFEWLADFGVENPGERARQVAGSFIRDGWTRPIPPEKNDP